MKRRLVLLTLLILFPCIIFAGHFSAAERTYNVLFIQSYSHRTPWNDRLTEGVRDGLSREGVNADVTTEFLDADFWPYASECVIMRRICERARQRNVDLIITVSDEAFYTLTHCGDSLPFQVPVVVSGIKFPNYEEMARMDNVCGYTALVDFKRIFRDAQHLFPGRTEIICLTDSSRLGLRGAASLDSIWPEFQREAPQYSLRKYNVQSKSPNSIIASICYDYNAYNRIVIAPKWTPFLSFIGKNSKAPVFAGQSVALTNGVFCVHDSEPYEGALAAGRLGAQVLQGTPPSSLGIVNLPGTLLYDYRQLEFFKVSTARVKDTGIILNQPLMERYSIWFALFYSFIVGALIFLVVWLYRLNRHESRRRMHAQTRLLIQNRLVEQRDEFDNIFCSIRDGLITYDTDFRIHFVNRALMLMLKLNPETHTARYYEGQMSGSIFRIYCKGEDILQSLLKQVRAERRVVPIPEEAFMQEIHIGTYFPVSGEVVPIYSKNKMTGVAICCRNISEEEMHKRFFNLAVDVSSVYPWQYDIRSSSFHFAGALLDHFGFSGEVTLLRKELEQLIHPEDLEQTRQRFSAIFRGAELNARMNFRLRNGSGKYEWWEFRSTSYNGLSPEAPYMVLGICQSIQRYKSTEEELIAARDRALQADTLKSAFLANMSHEIRTPLNAIVGFSDLLKDIDAFSPEEVRQFVDTININCTLLLALINDILDLSRIESGSMDFRFAGYNLTFVMQQIYESQRLSMPEGVKLIMKVPEGEGKSIITDNVRLKQVINNFINNAKKFTTKGSITFGYEVGEPGFTTFFVEDTGSGISEENQKRIFERFYKVDSFTQGAGLGLSICQTIVERFSGTIDVTSELGKGTRFTVRVPDSNE